MLVHTSGEIRDHFGGGVLVPTMGALHEGHAALIRKGREVAAARGGLAVVVWVFVNPTQFNQRADFDRYPRDLEQDVAFAMRAGADVVYAPEVGEVYPSDFEVPVGVLPSVATEPGLEDRFRPGHFAGVVQVVRRMFVLTEPSAACFGEKDWQQLAVIRAMVGAESIPVELVAVPTVRESDGLALSSRNRRLGAEARRQALAISVALRAVERVRDVREGESLMREILDGSGLGVEYAAIRDEQTLQQSVKVRARALIAAWAGSGDEAVRLIDNSSVMLELPIRSCK